MTQTAEILEALPPAQMQPTGLAQFDLAVTATPLVINWNRDAVSALLDATLEQYEKLVVQEEDVPAIKSEMAGLNKLRDRLDNARKEITRQIAGPLEAFDAEAKALVARVVEVRAGLDAQVKEFERRDREGRRQSVQFVIDALKTSEGVPELDIPMPGRNQAHLMLIFKTAPDTSPDTPALDLLETSLGGMGGPLFRDLRDKQGLGYTVTAFNRQTSENGYMVFYIGTEPGKMAQAEEGFKRIINDLHQNLLSEEDVNRGKNQLEGDYYRNMQSLGSRSGEAAALTMEGYPLSFTKDQIEKSKNVTPEQLREIVKKYLNVDSAYTIKVLP